jgi:GntR family histidine utilization transcriptional repressor
VLKRALVAAEEEIAQRLGLKRGAQVLHVQCLHVIDEIPNNVEERWINPATAPGALDADFKLVPPGTWLLRHIPWTGAEHTISAVNAGAELARRLDIAAGEACLVIARRTWKADGFVTFVKLTYPGSRQSFVGRFGPHAPAESGG